MERDLTPDAEHLARLVALTKRYGLRRAVDVAPSSESARHAAETGHKLSYGCCRPASSRSTSPI
jgi:hypothetical protein